MVNYEFRRGNFKVLGDTDRNVMALAFWGWGYEKFFVFGCSNFASGEPVRGALCWRSSGGGFSACCVWLRVLFGIWESGYFYRPSDGQRSDSSSKQFFHFTYKTVTTKRPAAMSTAS